MGRTWAGVPHGIAGLALLLCALIAAPGTAGAQEPSVDAAALEPLLEAARAKGLNVVVIGPQQPEPETVRAMPSGGNALAELGGRVTKQAQSLVAATAAPGWPEPASDPMKPLLNGLLTVIGLAAGLLVARRAGLDYRERFAPEPDADRRPSRPARVARAALGLLIAAVAAMVLPFAVHGPGSRTVELVGAITEIFLRCAVVLLVAVPLLERANERFLGAVRRFDPARVTRDLRVVLTTIFLFTSAALTLTFMYPDPAVATLARLAFATLVSGLAILLSSRHRDALAVLASTAAGGRLRSIANSAWLLLAGYFALAWAIACVRILLRIPEPADLVVAPIAALLGGVAAYHLSLWIFSLFVRRGTETTPIPGVVGPVASGVERWPPRLARAIGVAAGLVLGFERLGFPMERADGSLAAIPATAIVFLLAYAVWAYASEAIDRRIALESGPEPAPDGEAEGGPGRSRLATLLPIVRNALQLLVLFVTGLVLLHEAGVNTTPIFASAGIVGLAIGFGAQSLVKDIISGLFFLLDDAFRVGEYIETGGIKGSVERISIRSMQLRHHNGPLNTIAFGSINELTNYSRDWVIMKLPIVVTLDTDVERVRKLVKKLGVELLNDPQVGHKFIEPLKSQGVLSIDNWGITIRVKFKTRPGDQFAARRVVYTKLHEMFESEGIQFASRDVKIKIDSAHAGAAAEERAISAAAMTLDETAPAGAAATRR